MATPIIVWPSDVLRVRNFSYMPRAVNRRGGRDLSGRAQVITSGEQIWRLSLDLTPDHTPDRVRRFDALVAQMQGAANIAQFNLCDPLRYSADVSPLQQDFSDATRFSDDTGFGVDGSVEPLVVTSGASVDGTSVTVGLTDPTVPAPQVGHHFAHDFFLYRIVGVSGGVLQFLPRARTAMLVDDVLATDAMPVRMKFADDDVGEAWRDYGRFRRALTLEFEEAFER